jgi:hypothetical protein
MSSSIKLIVLLAMGVGMVMFSGCTHFDYDGPQKYTGGGWIEVHKIKYWPEGVDASTLFDSIECGNQNNKATFGFEFSGAYDESCEEATIVGQFEYNDHKNDVAFHGVVDDYKEKCYGDDKKICFHDADCVTGSYTPQPKNLGPGGTFLLCVKDGGIPGPDKYDEIALKLYGGVFNGYAVKGEYLEGGNIVAHYPN